MRSICRALLIAAAALATAQSLAQPPGSAGPADPQLIEDLVAANRILAMEGVVDGMGHVSVRHNRDPNRYLMSRARAPALVTAEDILEFDLDSNPVDLRGRALYSERFIHGEIYKARPDVMAVVHNHSPAVIPFTVSSIQLRAVAHSGGFIAEGLPIYEIRNAGGMTDMLVRNAPLGRALASDLGTKAAVLMRGHGAAVVGPSLPHVVGRSIYLEVGAKLQAEAIALGGTINYLDPEEGRRIEARRDYSRPWELWKRKAMAK
ncbi:MAG TPA: class II aldolase/adducin family protein [Burkholderiales bacterium]|nr:class II aldolase/adducin family protein [Burkholderiales bacterium]